LIYKNFMENCDGNHIRKWKGIGFISTRFASEREENFFIHTDLNQVQKLLLQEPTARLCINEILSFQDKHSECMRYHHDNYLYVIAQNQMHDICVKEVLKGFQKKMTITNPLLLERINKED